MERGKEGLLPRRRAGQEPGERSWGARAGDQGRSPPQRGRPAGPAEGERPRGGRRGGITGLGARRGPGCRLAREGMRGGGERSGCGSARQGQGTADQGPADRETRHCCHLSAEAGDAGCGDRWAVRWLGRPLPPGPARCLPGIGETSGEQVHWGSRARKPGALGPWSLASSLVYNCFSSESL